MPEIAHGLAQHIGEENKRDVAKNSHTPGMVATNRLVDVKGCAAVLGLFGAVPQPHGFQPRLGACKCFRVKQQPVGKNGGEVFSRSSSCDMYAHITMGVGLKSLQGAAFDFVAITPVFQVAIEKKMNPPVRGLLAHKALHFGGVLFLLCVRQAFQAVPYRIDKVLLTHRKAHGQGAEEGRAKRIAAIPPGGERRGQVDQQATYNQIGHGASKYGVEDFEA